MILHIVLDEKFINDYVLFVNKRFDKTKHKFILLVNHENLRYPGPYIEEKNVEIIRKNWKDFISFFKQLKMAEKIILHGMFSNLLPFILGFRRFAKKTYWVLWGGDLYVYRVASAKSNLIKKRLIRRLKGITCELKDDYQLAVKWYGAKCKYFPCMLYFSNIVKEENCYDSPGFTGYQKQSEYVRVMVGNSADPMNKHFELLDRLLPYKDKIQLVVPLSYGNQEYGDKVEDYIKLKYGHNQVVLREFVPLSEYIQLLKTVDIAVFAHNRQQALGNTIQLVALGIKVYLNGKTTTYSWLRRNGIVVYDSRRFDKRFLMPLTETEKKSNAHKIRECSNEESLYYDWKNIFED